ncbi:MAG: TonB-dependent receptor, partial [Bacteroidales bacterium]
MKHVPRKEYSISPRNRIIILLCLFLQFPLFAREFSIRGVVTDNYGEPLTGVNVMIKDTKTGVITDINGEYTISAAKGQKLVFSFIGMKNQEVLINDQTLINVTLLENTEMLDDVVVVGYGTQKKVSVVGSITTVDNKLLKAIPSRSVSNALAGQMAGVIAVQRSGEPGYDNSNFWIRGISTFGGARSPLVLIDGVERDINNIDSEEIESFSILKDASATAIYGVRGANGIIVITTRKGKEGPPKISVRYEYSLSQPTKLPRFLGSADYLDIMNESLRESGLPENYSSEIIDRYRNNEDADLYPNVNWIDAITDNYASNQRVNININGGSKFLRYSLVGSVFDERGILSTDPRQDWNSRLSITRYNVRSNVDVDLTKTTLLNMNIGGYLQEGNRPPQNIDDLFKLAFETPPYVHPTRYSSGEIPRVRERGNPWSRATQHGFERNYSSSIQSQASIEQSLNFITKGLKAKIIFAFDAYNDGWVKRDKNPKTYMPATKRNDDGTLDLSLMDVGDEYLKHGSGGSFGSKSTYLEANMTWARDFGSNHVDALFLYNQRHRDWGDKWPSRNQGFAGRLSYGYGGKYLGEFNFGYNGSENFQKGKRYGFFPSVALGYLISEESFFHPLYRIINKLKIRGSYGLVGNDQIDGRRFPYITTILEAGGYVYGYEGNHGYRGWREGEIGNNNLTWETVKKGNLGIEIGVLNALNIQFDVFLERRENIFMERNTIPGSLGLNKNPWVNYGIVENQGLDASLEFNKSINKNLDLSLRGNITYAHSNVIEKDVPPSLIGTHRVPTGKPVNQIWGLEDLGLFTEDDFEDIQAGKLKPEIPEHTFGPVRPGDIRYKDIDNNHIVNEADRNAIGGSWDPEIVYGFGANIRYKQFDFGCFFQGVGRTWQILGRDIMPGAGQGGLYNIYDNAFDHWTQDNPRQDAFYPRLYWGQNANNNQESSFWLHNFSFIRLKN